jgi:hypothetical protein
VQHTPVHVPLQGCSSFKLNPRLAAQAAPPPHVRPLATFSLISPLKLALFQQEEHLKSAIPPAPLSLLLLWLTTCVVAGHGVQVKLAVSDLLAKMKEMDAKLKQRPTYDPCFEVEIIAQTKVDRRKQVQL